MRFFGSSLHIISTMLCMLSDMFKIVMRSHDLTCLNENMNPQNILFKMQIIIVLADDDDTQKRQHLCL